MSPCLNRTPRTFAECIQQKITSLEVLKHGATARRTAEIQGEIGELRRMVAADLADRK